MRLGYNGDIKQYNKEVAALRAEKRTCTTCGKEITWETCLSFENGMCEACLEQEYKANMASE